MDTVNPYGAAFAVELTHASSSETVKACAGEDARTVRYRNAVVSGSEANLSCHAHKTMTWPRILFSTPLVH